MVWHGHAFTSLPIPSPNLSSLSYMGRSASLPVNIVSTYFSAAWRYSSGSAVSAPLPSARSAIHHAEFVPSPCSDLSHSRRSFSVGGPDLLTILSHSFRERPVFSFSVVTHFCVISTPGWTPYSDLT